MSTGLERIVTLTFGAEGNEANYLGGGWSGNEHGHRWMVGHASEIWLENPGRDHDLILEIDAQVLVEPPVLVAQRMLVGVRQSGIAQVSIAKDATLGFHIPPALVAAPGPVRIVLVHPDFRRPMDLRGGTDDRELSIAVRGLRLSRVLHRRTPAGGPPLPPDQLMLRYESLGDNCEFGLVQRKLGVEPLGLLRFSYIELVQLLRGLRNGFDGLGDPATVSVLTEGADREYVVRETAYYTTYHTFQYERDLDVDTIRRQQSTKLNFLKRKFMEDATGGEKIFVIKRLDPLRPEEVLPIYTALNDLGRNWLLWVVPADATHRSGTVDVLLPGLMRGYVDRFAPYDDAHDLSLSSWTAVCEAAWKAVGGPVGI